MTDFEVFWKTHYPNASPTGWMMRNAGAKYWIRFHSLPESKQYADDEEEWAILLSRQNELAAEVIGEGQICWMVQSRWPASDQGNELDYFRETRENGLNNAFTFLSEIDEDDAVQWTAAAILTVWHQGAFDGALRRIADEKAGPTIWISVATGSVFAPYDGGVDLFLDDEGKMNALRNKHEEWLPAHP